MNQLKELNISVGLKVFQSSQNYLQNQYCAIPSLIFVICSGKQLVKWLTVNSKNDKNEKMVGSYNVTFISNIKIKLIVARLICH